MSLPRRVPSLSVWRVSFLFVAACLTTAQQSSRAHADQGDSAKIRVVVWDEQQPEQKKAYPSFLGQYITDYLKRQPGLEVESVSIDHPQKGLSDEVLDDCDVLIWWGHVRNGEISAAEAAPVIERLKQGKLSLLALHSAHWATPFVMAMHERASLDALAQLPPKARETANVEFIGEFNRRPPGRDEELSPQAIYEKQADGTTLIRITRPNCCFPAYRNDGKPSEMRTLLPQHPIAREIPSTFTLAHTEMYDEPFHVPAPDAVIFAEHWEHGEHFRSGAVWQIGKGKVFYFRPGHETHAIFTEKFPMRIVENAVRWLGDKSTAATDDAPQADVFSQDNLVAWCIVPFDAKKRGPAERAEMLERLGIKKVAYDWRDEHVATFEEEILQYKKHHLEFFAFWAWHPALEPLIRKYGIHPQLWLTNPSPAADSQEAKVKAAAEQLLPLVQKAKELDCQIGLYNHGGWGGEPQNLVAVCQYLREHHEGDHVGIVYNFHHGHEHIADFAESLKLMQPYLLCLNLNGMNDKANPKILPIGQGQHEAEMLKTIRASGYAGPIGILDHRDDMDAEESLRLNLEGLKKIRAELTDVK